VAHGVVARTAGGAPYLFGNVFGGTSALIDFTNPAARSWWGRQIRDALDLGADGFMQDFGEEVMPGMVFHDGSRGLEMHNRYPALFHRTTRRILDAYVRRHPERQPFFFTRAGYTGRPGGAAYENANFPGDETTDWTKASGLASQTPDMLNRAVGGAFGFTTDIGGFFDVGPYQATTKELFLRWAEWAALSPMFRLHGSVFAGTHTPWSYDHETLRVYKRLERLHLRARPLIARLWRHADATGVPVTRPLWLAYPHDPVAAKQDQEWLLGPDVLVAPVVTQGSTSRSVYLPRGCWRNPHSGERVSGPGARRVAAPLARLPYFVRCGTKPLAAAG
jgi:alpha-D-xyloside xylohydrolase